MQGMQQHAACSTQPHHAMQHALSEHLFWRDERWNIKFDAFFWREENWNIEFDALFWREERWGTEWRMDGGGTLLHNLLKFIAIRPSSVSLSDVEQIHCPSSSS